VQLPIQLVLLTTAKECEDFKAADFEVFTLFYRTDVSTNLAAPPSEEQHFSGSPGHFHTITVHRLRLLQTKKGIAKQQKVNRKEVRFRAPDRMCVSNRARICKSCAGTMDEKHSNTPKP